MRKYGAIGKAAGMLLSGLGSVELFRRCLLAAYAAHFGVTGAEEARRLLLAGSIISAGLCLGLGLSLIRGSLRAGGWRMF
jgi:hypothetical protein